MGGICLEVSALLFPCKRMAPSTIRRILLLRSLGSEPDCSRCLSDRVAATTAPTRGLIFSRPTGPAASPRIRSCAVAFAIVIPRRGSKPPFLSPGIISYTRAHSLRRRCIDRPGLNSTSTLCLEYYLLRTGDAAKRTYTYNGPPFLPNPQQHRSLSNQDTS